jgi:hypothetical protein
MNKKITGWTDTYTMCGRFQYCTCEDPLVYHADHQRWAATVYLTPDAPYECGTSLLAHKETRIRHVSVEGSDIIWSKKFLDPTPWDSALMLRLNILDMINMTLDYSICSFSTLKGNEFSSRKMVR